LGTGLHLQDIAATTDSSGLFFMKLPPGFCDVIVTAMAFDWYRNISNFTPWWHRPESEGRSAVASVFLVVWSDVAMVLEAVKTRHRQVAEETKKSLS